MRSSRIKQLLKQLSMLDLICFSFTAPVELIAATLDEIQARTTEEEFIQICNLIMN